MENSAHSTHEIEVHNILAALSMNMDKDAVVLLGFISQNMTWKDFVPFVQRILEKRGVI